MPSTGKKIDRTYCPLCGNMGLVEVNHKGATWAICPLDADGEATVDTPTKAHTGYVISTKAAVEPSKPKETGTPAEQPGSPGEIDNG